MFSITELFKLVIEYIDSHKEEVKGKTIREITNEVHKYLLNKKLYSESKMDHKMYPICETERPIINMKKCMHHECNKEFETCDELITHLKSHKNYVWAYSKHHEGTKYIVSENKFLCGSPTCTDKFDNEKDVITHYKLLGIEPYFNKDEPNNLQDYINYYYKNKMNSEDKRIRYDQVSLFVKLIIEGKVNPNCKKCRSCYKKDSNIVFDSCLHIVVCNDCVNKINSKKCVWCYKNYDEYLQIY